MKEVTKWLLFISLCIVIGMGAYVEPKKEIINNKEEVPKESNELIVDTLSFNLSNLSKVIDYYGIKHKDIVIRQFILETGWGTSYSFKERNNLFGLTNPRTKTYFNFDHWTESVEAYKTTVQYKYKKGDYYKFLRDLPYAMDTSYINKLKCINYDI